MFSAISIGMLSAGCFHHIYNWRRDIFQLILAAERCAFELVTEFCTTYFQGVAVFRASPLKFTQGVYDDIICVPSSESEDANEENIALEMRMTENKKFFKRMQSLYFKRSGRISDGGRL